MLVWDEDGKFGCGLEAQERRDDKRWVRESCSYNSEMISKGDSIEREKK